MTISDLHAVIAAARLGEPITLSVEWTNGSTSRIAEKRDARNADEALDTIAELESVSMIRFVVRYSDESTLHFIGSAGVLRLMAHGPNETCLSRNAIFASRNAIDGLQSTTAQGQQSVARAHRRTLNYLLAMLMAFAVLTIAFLFKETNDPAGTNPVAGPITIGCQFVGLGVFYFLTYRWRKDKQLPPGPFLVPRHPAAREDQRLSKSDYTILVATLVSSVAGVLALFK